MDSPPEREDPRPWLAIGARLAAAGLHVPAVRAQDLQQGFLLIEDLGTRLYLTELNDTCADRLYGDAMDALLAMQSRVASADLPPFDHQVLVNGLEVMPEWFLQRHLGHTPKLRGVGRAGSRVRPDRGQRAGTAALFRAPRLPQPQPAADGGEQPGHRRLPGRPARPGHL
ncbi:hypothetical protein RLIN73S_02889 [Rhodanobacter lindaniclasticus]